MSQDSPPEPSSSTDATTLPARLASLREKVLRMKDAPRTIEKGRVIMLIPTSEWDAFFKELEEFEQIRASNDLKARQDNATH